MAFFHNEEKTRARRLLLKQTYVKVLPEEKKAFFSLLLAKVICFLFTYSLGSICTGPEVPFK